MRSTGLPNRSSRLRTVLAAFGLTTICLAREVEPLVRPAHDLVYHWSGRPSALFVPPLIELLVLFVLLAILLLSAERQGIWRSLVWVGIVVSLPWIAVDQVQQIWPGALPQWVRLPPFWLALIACPVLAWIFTRFASDKRESIIELLSVVLAFTALSSVLFVSQMLWFWWKARALNETASAQRIQVTGTAPAKPRFIFILMDELSYQQVYEHRYPGLQLPAFDALAADSTVFTDVTAANNFTEMAVPSLLSGQLIDDHRSTAAGMLQFRTVQGGPWRPFQAHNTIFQDALSDGYSTAVVGWYNPYCRILKGVLDRCYWTDEGGVKNGLFPDGTVGSNLVSSVDEMFKTAALGKMVQWTLHDSASLEHPVTAVHLQDYRDLSQAGDKVLLDPSANFVFLHLPIPHPGGIYNRQKHELTTRNSTYIDNLALSDEYLAHVRALLEKTGQWDSSTILLMGDHGWRTTLVWERSSAWGPEEERASFGGKFDSRPAYIVKLAHQKSGVRIDAPFEAVRTRALTDALLSGKIQSADELRAWVEEPKEQTASGY